MNPFSNERRFVRFIAGTVTATGTALGTINQWFYIIPLFAGLNLLQSSITGICPPELLYKKYISN